MERTDLVESGSDGVGEHSKDDDGKDVKDVDGNIVSKRKKPGDGNGKKEAKAAAPEHCRKDSSGDKGIACKKVKP